MLSHIYGEEGNSGPAALLSLAQVLTPMGAHAENIPKTTVAFIK